MPIFTPPMERVVFNGQKRLDGGRCIGARVDRWKHELQSCQAAIRLRKINSGAVATPEFYGGPGVGFAGSEWRFGSSRFKI